MSFSVSVENGETVVSAPPPVLEDLQKSIRELLHCDPGNSLSVIRFVAQTTVPKTLTLKQRQIVKFLYPEVKQDAPFEEFEKIQALHLELLEAATIAKPQGPIHFTQNGKIVSMTLAALLVEVFGVNQPRNLMCRTNKLFDSNPIFTLLLPIPVPVKFSQIGSDSVQLALSNPTSLPASITYGLLNKAITAVISRKIIRVEFNEVDRFGFERDLQMSLAKNNGIALIKSEDRISDEDDARSFTIWAVPLSESVPSNLKDKFERQWFAIARRPCANCGVLFSDQCNEPCVIRKHEGERIPFEDGLDEHQIEETGEIIVRYECCGEVEADCPGCVEAVIEPLHVGTPGNDLSTWEYSEEPGNVLQN
jgi:hypothetical protein